MGTNYVESSLKRFLKRKVKVTLGLVVAFMITGTVGFAETISGPIIEGKGDWLPANEWLEGIGTEENFLTDNINITIGTDNITVLKSEEIKNLSKYMSNNIKEYVKNIITLTQNATKAGIEGNEYNFSGHLAGDDGNYSIGLS